MPPRNPPRILDPDEEYVKAGQAMQALNQSFLSPAKSSEYLNALGIPRSEVPRRRLAQRGGGLV